MIGLFKKLIAWLLEKIASRIPEPPKAEQEGYFQHGSDETLQGELKKVLLKSAASLRKKKEKPADEEREKLSTRFINLFNRIKERVLTVPRMVKILVVTTIPICAIYIVLYLLMVNPPETNTEDIFRFSKGKPLIRIGYIREWPTSQLITTLLSQAMDANLNVDITTKPVSQNNLSDLWQMMVTDRVDLCPSVWLPDTHAAFISDAGSNIVDLGAWLEGCRLGLVVPDYLDIDSISDLTKDNSGGIIFCIDPSSKLHYMSKRAIELYGLENFRIIAKTDKYMVNRLEEALKKKEKIIVTGWKPHWMFGEWKLKMLEDPLKVFGDSEEIHLYVSSNFKNSFPDICQFLSNIKLDIKSFSDLLASSRRLDSQASAVSKWLHSNKNQVTEWESENE